MVGKTPLALSACLLTAVMAGGGGALDAFGPLGQPGGAASAAEAPATGTPATTPNAAPPAAATTPQTGALPAPAPRRVTTPAPDTGVPPPPAPAVLGGAEATLTDAPAAAPSDANGAHGEDGAARPAAPVSLAIPAGLNAPVVPEGAAPALVPATPVVPGIPEKPDNPEKPEIPENPDSPFSPRSFSPAAPAAPAATVVGPAPAPDAPAAETASVDEVRAAAAARTAAAVEDLLTIAGRMFAGGNYVAVRQVCEALLANPAFAPLPAGRPLNATAPDALAVYQQARLERARQREQVRYLHARALYEQALLGPANRDAQALVAAAAEEFDRLGANRWDFPEPRWRAHASHYAGRCHDYLTDYPSAIRRFRAAADLEPPPELDVENSISLARSLSQYAEILGEAGLARSPGDAVPMGEARLTRERLLKEAEQELAKISTQHPQNDRNQEIELLLIGLRYRLGAYGDVQYQAQEFLRRATPGSDAYAQASYYLANAVYRQGGLEEAAKLFAEALAQKIAAPRLRGELFLGQGRVNAKMAETAGSEMRQALLARAQTSLRQAVRLMPYGEEWDAAARDFASVLLELGEFREADQVLRDLLSHPRAEPQVVENYYAGLAARGLGDMDRARRHLQAVIELCAAGGRELRYGMQALSALAEIEGAAGRPAEALAYYRAAAAAAAFLREYDLYAAARLGGAQAQARLNSFDAAARDGAGRRLGAAVLGLLGDAASGAAVPLQTAARDVAFRAGALREQGAAAPENLTRALASLQELRGRMLARLREDELEYVEGRIVYWQAELARKGLRIGIQTTPDDYSPVLALYARAEEIIGRAIAANPRGAFSARARYLLAQVLNSGADLRRELAAELRRQGKGAEALPLESACEEAYVRALNPLGLAIADSEGDTALRVAARTLLGGTYLSLARISKEQALYYEKGLDALRILVNEPTIDGAQKTAAVRGIATALAGGGRLDEALALLLPQAPRDLASAVQAAELLQQQHQPRAAWRTLEEGLKNAPAGHPAARAARFALASLGLAHAADIAPDGDEAAATAIAGQSLSALGRLADDYPGTDWASRALLEMGRYLIRTRQYDRAVQYAEAGLSRGGRAVVTAQALHLMEGRALLAWGRERGDAALLERARGEFVKAERANIYDSPLGRRQRAFAIYEQGNAAAALGREEEALRFYGRVFAIFHQEYEPSDLSRLAAAAIHEKNGNYALAWQILDQGFDKDRLLDAKLRVEEKLKKEEAARR